MKTVRGLAIVVTALTMAMLAQPAVGSDANQRTMEPTGGITEVVWDEYLPGARAAAPPLGCDYGSDYDFSADDHGYVPNHPRFRTRVGMTIYWDYDAASTWTIPSVQTGITTVYPKNSDVVVEQRQATTENMQAKVLGKGYIDGLWEYVDIRLVAAARDPFCGAITGGIDGALTMRVTESQVGVISGEHRQVPNNYIYVNYYWGLNKFTTDIYKLDMANILCLLGSAVCQYADLSGVGGRYQTCRECGGARMASEPPLSGELLEADGGGRLSPTRLR